MVDLDIDFDATDQNDVTWLGLAAALHILLLLWNPVIMREAWKTLTVPGNGEAIIVEFPEGTVPVLPRSHGRSPTVQSMIRWPAHAPVSVVSPAPLIPRSFHAFSLPIVPTTMEPVLAPAVRAIPIPVGQGQEFHAQPSRNALVERGSSVRIHETVPMEPEVSNMEEPGGGRVLIRFTPSAPEAPAIQAPEHRSNSPAPTDASLEGPLAHRAILRRVIPQYPAWAEEQGITGTTRLYFTVTREGTIRSTIRITETSGYPELDRLAMEALEQWRFTAVADEGPQCGIVTFNFSLVRS